MKKRSFAQLLIIVSAILVLLSAVMVHVAACQMSSDATHAAPSHMRADMAPDDPATEMHYMSMASSLTSEQRQAQQRMLNAEQMRLLQEINQITVELYKRRADPNIISADTPKLIERLKKLSKKLNAS